MNILDIVNMAKVKANIIPAPVKELPEEPKENIVNIGMHGESISYNAKQLEAINYARQGKSFVLIGPAGSGKTTTSRACIQALLESGDLPLLAAKHRFLQTNAPGVAIISFTRRAVDNIRKVTPDNLKSCCITIHKLLEYGPVMEEGLDGRVKKIFKPNRTVYNPLPATLKVVVIEEASMVGTDLYNKFIEALPDPNSVQFIFLGDLFQLPPVMDTGILGYKMLELPIVELDKIYRQGENSPIISLAWDIKSGFGINPMSEPDPIPKDPLRKKFPAFEKISKDSNGKIEFLVWQRKIKSYDAVKNAAAALIKKYDDGLYNPDEDIILCPFEAKYSKSTKEELCSASNLNLFLADEFGRRRNAVVHHVKAMNFDHYFAIGDKVLYNKEDAVIKDIRINMSYSGLPFRTASTSLNRWGICSEASKVFKQEDMTNDDLEKLMASHMVDGEEDSATRKASHVITIEYPDGSTADLSAAGDVNNLLFGYAITVHKAQGSEWKQVFLLFHHSHGVMLSNEMLYTAVTRARENLIVICEAYTFSKGVDMRVIKGKTLQEKAEFFKGKKAMQQSALGRLIKGNQNAKQN